MRTRMLCTALLLTGVALLPAASTAAEGTLIVLNKSEATASLIDLASGSVAATMKTGEGPHEVAVSPDGKTAVAANYGTRESAGSSLTVIDVPGARVVRTIDLGEYKRPHGIQWLADGKHVVVTAEENQALITVDVETGEVTGAVETGQRISHMVVVTPDGARAFVANIGSGSLTVIDLVAGKHLTDIETGQGAEGLAITPDGSEIWVTNRGDDNITVIDSASLETLATLASGSFPIRAEITPDGRHVLVSNARSAEVAVFDARDRREIRRFKMEHSAEDMEGRLFGSFGDSSVPVGIEIHPDGKTAYVANANADIVSIIDLTTWKTVGVLLPGREPDGLGYSPERIAPGS